MHLVSGANNNVTYIFSYNSSFKKMLIHLTYTKMLYKTVLCIQECQVNVAML